MLYRHFLCINFTALALAHTPRAFTRQPDISVCGGSMSGPWVSFGVPMFRHAKSLARAFSVGVERYRVEIRFRDINYDAEVLTGSAGLPSNSNSFKTLALVKPAPRGHHEGAPIPTYCQQAMAICVKVTFTCDTAGIASSVLLICRVSACLWEQELVRSGR